MNRNRWPLWTGIGGRIAPEWEAALLRNTHSGFWAYFMKYGNWSIQSLYDAQCNHLNKYQYIYDNYIAADPFFVGVTFAPNLMFYYDMVEKGFSPTFVLHSLNMEEAKYIVDDGHKNVAIGYIDRRKPSWRYKEIIGYLYENNVNVHLLRCTDFNTLSKLPVYSSDSITYAAQAKYGCAYYWNDKLEGPNKTETLYFPKHGKYDKKRMKHYYKKMNYLNQFEDTIYGLLGYKISDLLGDYQSKRLKVINSYYYHIIEKEINKIHQQNGWIF